MIYKDKSYLIQKYSYPESAFVSLDGMPVHYRIVGSGHPLLLIHGVGASMHTWEPWVKQLKNYCQLILLDLPGFGLTGAHPKDDYSMKMYVAFIKDFLDKIGFEKVSVAGNSMGGEIAWKSCITYPEKFEKLFLLNNSGYYPDKKLPLPFELSKSPLAPILAEISGSKKLIKSNMQQIIRNKSIITEESVERYYELSRMKGAGKAFIYRSRLFGTEPAMNPADIQAPTLLIWGKKDPWVPEKHYRYYLSTIPKVDGVLYGDIGHIPQEEIPEKSADEVLRFLSVL